MNELLNKPTTRGLLIAALWVGAIGLAAGWLFSPQRALAGLLLGNFLFLSFALYGILFLALGSVFRSGWAAALRRLPDAFFGYLPIGLGLLAVIFVWLPELYPWLDPDVVAADPHLQHKAAYLNAPFFLARAAVIFLVWYGLGSLLMRRFRELEVCREPLHALPAQKLASLFLLLFGITFVVASFDWLMSLEPGWYSTMFPVYTFAGLALGGTALLTLLVAVLRERGALPEVTQQHVYELARLMLAASTFWAYIWFSQYMLIYYTNIPEEAVYFVSRLEGVGQILFPLNVVLSWLLPSLLLVPPRGRTSARWLIGVCLIVLAGRWLDLYLLVMPALHLPFQFGFPELLIGIGLAPLFLWAVARRFQPARSRVKAEG